VYNCGETLCDSDFRKWLAAMVRPRKKRAHEALHHFRPHTFGNDKMVTFPQHSLTILTLQLQ